jgi:uncharacterized protein YjbJ (UPF0337 family)
MNSHVIKGNMEKLAGKAKEAVGNATGNKGLVARGKGQQLKGGVRETFGHAKDAVSNATDYITGR